MSESSFLRYNKQWQQQQQQYNQYDLPFMQGWGNWFNTMVLVVLLAIFVENEPPYSTGRLNNVWRISYAIGLVPIIVMLVWRIFFLRVSQHMLLLRALHKFLQ